MPANCDADMSAAAAADLERLAKAHQPGPKEKQYPPPGRRIEGFKGSTVKVKLADQLESKHLGTLSETTDALECRQLCKPLLAPKDNHAPIRSMLTKCF